MKLFTTALAAVLAVGVSTSAIAAPIALGGSTSVVLTDGIASVASPIGPATLVGNTATFPITGGETGPDDALVRIFHSGGLLLGGIVALEDFIIDLTPPPQLFGFVNGGDDEVALFNIGSGLVLTLTDGAASALNGAFDTDAFSSQTVIGTATVNPETVPEPTSLLLLGTALAFAASRLRRS